MEEVRRLQGAPTNSQGQIVLEHVAASLALVAEFVLTPSAEFISMKRENENLRAKNLKLTTEAVQLKKEASLGWKAAEEETKRVKAQSIAHLDEKTAA